jgi:tellurite methyltransferase
MVISIFGVTFDFLMDGQMEYDFTQYNDKYGNIEEFYWGDGIWDVAYDVLRLMPSTRPIRLIDVGCGEGQAAVFFARNGYTVSAFDIAAAGLKKGRRLAAQNRLNVKFFQANLISYKFEEAFDIIYGHGVLEYVPCKFRKRFMLGVQEHTAVGGLNVFDAFVKKSFIETAPDWEAKKEYFWRTGELASYYGDDWKLEKAEEIIIDCCSGGTPHQHCMDVIVARKMA